MKTPAKPPPEPRPVPPRELPDRLEDFSPITTKSWIKFLGGAAFVGTIVFVNTQLFAPKPSLSPPPKPSTHGDVAANVIERGTSRARYIGPADEDLGSCVCAPELGGEKASDGATRTVCACTGKAWEGK